MAEPEAVPHQPHISVLYHEIIHALQPQSPGLYVDGTVGAGGHAWGILKASSPEGKLLGLDVDPTALELARQRLSEFGDRAALVQTSYTTLQESLQNRGWQKVQGIVLDLGVSSMQIDNPARGFSFQADGPLDMRLNPLQPLTAAEVVNKFAEERLADILWRYGEENQSRKIARTIVHARPIQTTLQLAEVVKQAVGNKQGRIHPATRTFQALRIAVNQELQALEDVLPHALEVLAPGGRLAVISFHSLEDRIVKQYFRTESRDCICPPEQPVCNCGHKATIREINRHPIVAAEDEIQQNTRARSARLRVVEKI